MAFAKHFCKKMMIIKRKSVTLHKIRISLCRRYERKDKDIKPLQCCKALNISEEHKSAAILLYKTCRNVKGKI